MSNTENEGHGGENPQDDDEMEAVQCKGCGTKFFGVNQEECDRWMAVHILDEHEDEASESVLEEARDRLEAMAE